MSGGRIKVLIIEDNDGYACDIEAFVTSEGLDCEITRFRDGREALLAP